MASPGSNTCTGERTDVDCGRMFVFIGAGRAPTGSTASYGRATTTVSSWPDPTSGATRTSQWAGPWTARRITWKQQVCRVCSFTEDARRIRQTGDRRGRRGLDGGDVRAPVPGRGLSGPRRGDTMGRRACRRAANPVPVPGPDRRAVGKLVRQRPNRPLRPRADLPREGDPATRFLRAIDGELVMSSGPAGWDIGRCVHRAACVLRAWSAFVDGVPQLYESSVRATVPS